MLPDSHFEGRRVVVLGGTGLIGTQLAAMLRGLGAIVTTVARNQRSRRILDGTSFVRANLLDVDDCIGAVKRADVIFNLAVYGGGILRNSTQSGQILTTNLLLQTNIIEAVRLSEAERYLFTSSVCAYPADLEMMSEDLAWQGPPDRSHEGFGWAKRIGEMQCRLYAEQYGMRIAIVRPTNSYGPYDNFDLKSSHVIPALVRKAVDHADPYVVWGNGATKREFIYSADVARGMILAIEKCPVADPINLGSGKEISILELTQLILKLTEHKPSTVVFDESKPRGQSRRVCDVRKAEEILGFHAEVAPSVGLKETIEWYRTEGHEQNPAVELNQQA